MRNTPATPTPSLDTSSFNHSWPIELKDWYEAYTAAADALTHLESRESAMHHDREVGHNVPAEEINTLRELTALAYQLKKRINAAGSKLLALWDEDNCSWRKPSEAEHTSIPLDVDLWFQCTRCQHDTVIAGGIFPARSLCGEMPPCPICNRSDAVRLAKPKVSTCWDGEKWVDNGPVPVCPCGKPHDDLNIPTPAEPRQGDLRVSERPVTDTPYGVEHFYFGQWCPVMEMECDEPLAFRTREDAEAYVTANSDLPF